MAPKVQDLFEKLPLAYAMPDLLPKTPNSAFAQIADEACKELAPELQAAIWLYVDDLERSHSISQGIPGPVGAYWHGIMHRREGDFWNAKYWFRQASEVRAALAGSLGESGAGSPHSTWGPAAFVDQVERAGRANPEELVEMQRREWMTLFTYCAHRAGE